jgi:hypothetical protein
MDDAFIPGSHRLRPRQKSCCNPRRPWPINGGFAPPYRRRDEEAAEAALRRKSGAAVRSLIPADEAKFWYIRRRLRLTTRRSSAGTPAIALRSNAIACGITRARTAAPFGVRRTTTSRLLVADRVRVTSPIFTRRVTTRDKVETSMLVLAATST